MAEPIREDASYGGVRVKMTARLGNIRIPIQVDVGFGDAVDPPPQEREFAVLLATLPAPVIRVYPPETVVAEKLEALVVLDLQNSRFSGVRRQPADSDVGDRPDDRRGETNWFHQLLADPA